jgi:spore coat polysaccharide biosynthesis predicted glycosyltransferase SpsG/L-amino acid N-acyltransferase YncA
MSLTVGLRCDAGPARGVGHLARCAALAEEAVARGHDVVLMGRYDGDIAERLLAPLLDVGVRLDPQARDLDLLHTDAYDVPDAPQPCAVVLSRMHDGRFGLGAADLLVDPTPGADAPALTSPAAVPPWRLRGSRYLPLRQAVLTARAERSGTWATGSSGPARPSRRVVTVLIGGTDPGNLRPALVSALAATGIDVDVRGPGPGLLADLVASDLVVTAAGTTLWEACVIGVPAAAVRAVDNQGPGYAEAVRSGAALGLGGPAEVRDTAACARRLADLLADDERREALWRAGSTLVDGLGAWRLVSAWEDLVAARKSASTAPPWQVRMRPANSADGPLLHQWRNDPQTRSASRTSVPVELAEHRRWLDSSLGRADRLLLVGEDAAGPVGTVRWDDAGAGEWEVSITVAPQRRAAGLAGPLLRAGQRALRDAGVRARAYRAVVHESNDASMRLFRRAGYVVSGPPDVAGFRTMTAPVPGAEETPRADFWRA